MNGIKWMHRQIGEKRIRSQTLFSLWPLKIDWTGPTGYAGCHHVPLWFKVGQQPWGPGLSSGRGTVGLSSKGDHDLRFLLYSCSWAAPEGMLLVWQHSLPFVLLVRWAEISVWHLQIARFGSQKESQCLEAFAVREEITDTAKERVHKIRILEAFI